MKQKKDAAYDLAAVQKNLVSFLESQPALIRQHGKNSIGSVSLSLGKCLLWIGPVLDNYRLTYGLPDVLPTVAQIGEEFRLVGLAILQNPDTAQIEAQIASLQQQVELLKGFSKIGGEQ